MAFKTVYNRNNVYDNAFRQIAAKNPGFAIGEFIGDILARNYNSRGINKAVNKALEDYGTGGSLADQQAALQKVKQGMAQQQGNGTGNSVMSEMEALNNVRQNLGLDNQQAQPAISVGVAPQQNPQELAALVAAPQAQPETQEQAIARLAQMPGADIMAQENAARNMGNFDMNTALANARQQMIKDGRTPYQIEQAMQILNPHFQKMQDDAYKIGAEKIMAELGATDDKGNRVLSDPEYKQRIVDLATQYGDIGKAAANLYGKDIISGRELWGAQQQEAKENRMLNRQLAQEDRRFNRQLAIADRNNSVRMAIAQARGAGKNNTAGTGGVSKEDATWADKKIKDLEEKLATLRLEDPKANLSQTDIQIYNQAAAIRDLANQQRANRYNLGGNTQQQNAGTGKHESAGREFNRNDYNDQARALLGMIRANKGVLDDNVAAEFRKIIGLDPNNTNPDEMTNQVIYDLRAYRKDADKDKSGHGGKSGLF